MTIHELEERAEVENSHAVDIRTDQSGSDEEIPATSAASATSISWTYDISPHIFQFTGHCGIKIPLPVRETSFPRLNFFWMMT